MATNSAFNSLKERLDANAMQYDGGATLDDLNDKKQKSKVLARTFALEYLKFNGHEYIDEDVFNAGFIDGKDDCGIDVLIVDNGRVHIIQAKYVGSSKNCKREDIDTFHKVFERIGDPAVQKNKFLLEILDDINWESDHFHFWFVTNGKIEGNSQLASTHELVIPGALKDRGFAEDQILDNEVISQTEFLEGLRYQEVTKDYSDTTETIVAAEKSEIISIEENHMRVVFLVVEATKIVELAKTRKSDLFDYNIRGALGLSTTTNKKIKETALERPHDFLFFNNGISAICSDLTFGPSSDRVTAKNIQVINGAQTVRSLMLAERERGKSGSAVAKVLLKITEIPNFKTSKVLIEEMVRTNNTQNAIKTSDFRSNDFVQVRYKEIFSKYSRSGRKIDYLPKRQESKNSKTTHLPVHMPDLAKHVFAFNESPYLSENGGNDSLFQLDKNYTKVFGKHDQEPNPKNVVNNLAIYILWLEFSEMLKLEKKNVGHLSPEDKVVKINAIDRGPLIFNIASQILDHIGLKEKLLDQIIKQTTFKVSDSKGIGPFVKELFDSSVNLAILAYKFSKVSSLKSWQRGKEGTPDAIKTVLTNFPVTDRLKDIPLV